MSKIVKFIGKALAFGLLVSNVQAGTPLTVELDQSQLITINADPGSVVVGNPSIADASINGRQIFIHGHTFGQTNVMVFDNNGNKLMDYELTVTHNTSNQVTMFMGNVNYATQRYSYSCAPNCEVNMIPGDNFDFTKNVILLSRAKYEFATGQKSADAKAPAAPQ
jgi:Pilus formation protein N terminal region